MNKVLIITVTLQVGGAEKIAVNLANELSDQNYNVTLLVLKSRGPLATRVNYDVNLVHLNIRSLRYGLYEYFKFIRNTRAEIVISNMRNANVLVGLTAKFFSFKRVIFREATTFTSFTNYNWFKRKILITFLSYAYSSADKLVTNSDYTFKELEKYKIIKPEKVEIIGNPVIELSSFIEDKERGDLHRWLKEKDTKVILYAGRLHKVKNLSNLILAFGQLSRIDADMRMILLGEGDERPSLERIVRQNNLCNKVDFVPFVDNPLPFYVHCNIFVLPSSWEGFGNVLVEAICCGAPVLVNNCPGGAVDLVKKSRIYKITDCNDLNTFVFDMKKFIDAAGDKKQPNSVIEYFMKNYNTSHITEKYVKVINEL